MDNTNVKDPVLIYFEKLNTYPRPSDYEAKVSDYLLSFGQEHGFTCKQDKGMDETGKHPVNNVVIYKPAQNSVNQSLVILQAHMDMVPAVDEAHSGYDFSTQPIHPHVEGNLMTGRGSEYKDGVWIENPDIHTTLGADDGIGVATILTLLDDKEISHPPLLAVFTTGEEIGMVGAHHLTKDFLESVVPSLDGVSLINVDEEQDGRFCYGCAGGIGLDFNKTYQQDTTFQSDGYKGYTLTINGLLGGHSGIYIGTGRANANCLLGKMLNSLSIPYVLFELSGGSAENAIAQFAAAKIGILPEFFELLQEKLMQYWELLKEEYPLEETMQYSLKEIDIVECKPLGDKDKKELLNMICEMPNDALAFMTITPTDSEIEPYEIPETSSNLGQIKMTWDNEKQQGTIAFISSARSFYEDKIDTVIAKMQHLSNIYEFILESHDRYSSWVQKDNSQLKELFEDTYREQNQKSAEGRFIHAGLECGVFADILGKETDMIACGPTIHDVHKPKETLYLDTVPNVYRLLKEVLRKLAN